jgi:hypothetical protein
VIEKLKGKIASLKEQLGDIKRKPEREDPEIPQSIVGGSPFNGTAQGASVFPNGRYSAMEEIVETIASAPVDVATDLVNQIRAGTDIETIASLNRVHKRPMAFVKDRGRGSTSPLVGSRRTGRHSQNSNVDDIFIVNLV